MNVQTLEARDDFGIPPPADMFGDAGEADDSHTVWLTAESEAPASSSSPSPPRPVKKRRIYTARRLDPVRMGTVKLHDATLENDGTVIESAFDTATRMMAEGVLVPTIPTCAVCAVEVGVFTDNQRCVYICQGCGLTLGMFYDGRSVQIHEDDPEDKEGRVHAHPDTTVTVYEERRAGGGDDGVGTVTMREIVDLGTVSVNTHADRKHGYTGKAKSKTVGKPRGMLPIASNIKHAVAAIDALMQRLGLGVNGTLRSRAVWLASRYMEKRPSADRAIRGPVRIAVGCLLRACNEMEMGVGRSDMKAAGAGGVRDSVKTSAFARELADVLRLPPIERGAVMRGYLIRYVNGMGSRVRPGERRHIDGLFSWLRWAVDILQYLPYSAERKVPLVAKGSGRYQWVRQLTDAFMATAPKTPMAEDNLWRGMLKPSIVASLRPSTAPAIVQPHEWPLRLCAPATLAATTVWLVTQMRRAIPKRMNEPRTPAAAARRRLRPRSQPDNRRRRHDARHPFSSEDPIFSLATAAIATTPTIAKAVDALAVYRWTQKNIQWLTGVNPVSVKNAKRHAINIWTILYSR